MKESTSKIVLLVEAIVLVLPVGGLLLMFVPWIVSDVMRIGNAWGLLVAVLAVVPFLAGVRLMLAFWLRGAEGIRENRRYAWRAAGVGAAVVILATILTYIAVYVHDLRRMAETTALFMFGLPLLIPLTHLYLESIHRPLPGAIEDA